MEEAIASHLVDQFLWFATENRGKNRAHVGRSVGIVFIRLSNAPGTIGVDGRERGKVEFTDDLCRCFRHGGFVERPRVMTHPARCKRRTN